MIIRKAIFPIAGLGTRFLPATKASPKEMLPIVDKPLIQYAVEEAYAAGIRQMIFVTGRSKRAVEDHFDVALELELELENAHKQDLLAVLRSIKPHDMECVYVRQARAFGLGHAVLCGKHLIGDEAFAVLLADDLMVGQTPVLAQMMTQFMEHKTSIIAVQSIPLDHCDRYGMIDGTPINEKLIDIHHIIEKPKRSSTPSTIAVVGRYILTPGIFKDLAIQKQGVGGEIQLTDAIASLIQREKIYAYTFSGIRYDCGTKLGFLQASVDLAEKHDEIGFDFSEWLSTRQSTQKITA